MRIGLLEDDVAIQELLLLVLEEEGYSVVNFPTADDCMKLLTITLPTALPIDLLIMDWRLGGHVLGTEIIHHIRTQSHLDALPIILMTAATISDLEAVSHSRVSLLQKPFSVDEILLLIQRLVPSHSTLSSD